MFRDIFDKKFEEDLWDGLACDEPF